MSSASSNRPATYLRGFLSRGASIVVAASVSMGCPIDNLIDGAASRDGGGGDGGDSREVSTDLLKSLSLSNGTLSPPFSSQTYGYTTTVNGSIFSPTTLVVAKAVSPSANISIANQPAMTGIDSAMVKILLTPASIPIVVSDSTAHAKTNVTVESFNAQTAYIKASNAMTGRHFGNSVALSADGTTLAVGAPDEGSAATGINNTNPGQSNFSAPEAGAVYLFTKSGESWTQVAYVKASNARTNSYFGSSLSLSGDGSTLAVGAFGESSNAMGVYTTNTSAASSNMSAPGAGAVYLFSRGQGGWGGGSQVAYIKASNAAMDARFGFSVALSIDGLTLAVGAPNESSKASDNGAAYLFSNSGGSWAQIGPVIYPVYINEGFRFGTAVALSQTGDVLAVGAPTEPSGATGINNTNPGPMNGSQDQSGAAYLFLNDGANVNQVAYVKASNTFAGDNFGASLALSSNGSVLAVGSIYESSDAIGIDDYSNQNDQSAMDAGAVYLFSQGGGTWATTGTEMHYIKASNTYPESYFGRSVSLSGDGSILVVGADGESSKATEINGNPMNLGTPYAGAGAAYLFTETGKSLAQTAYAKASNARADSSFGHSVALSSDGTALAVGGSGDSSDAAGVNGNQSDTSAPSAGAVYVFH